MTHQITVTMMQKAFYSLLVLFAFTISVQTVQAQVKPAVEVFVSDFSDHAVRQRIESSATAFLTEINQAFIQRRNPRPSSQWLHPDAHGALQDMWRSNRFYIDTDNIIEMASTTTDGTHEMRNIPLQFQGSDGQLHYEEAVITFDARGIAQDIRIGLPSHQYQQVLRQGEDVVDSANRQRILTFAENFRTAFNRKDIDYINTVFSDQALIIVGRVVEGTGTKSDFQQQVEYLQFTKTEYIDRLRNIFRANTWIDVGFEDIRILRHPRHRDIYGVNLTQYYNSSIYSDVGYLFLLVDFRQKDKPMIHVRTWQPRNVTPEDKIFTLGDMEIF